MLFLLHIYDFYARKLFGKKLEIYVTFLKLSSPWHNLSHFDYPLYPPLHVTYFMDSLYEGSAQ